MSQITPLPPVAVHTSGKHKGRPLSESPYWDGCRAFMAGKPRTPPSAYPQRGRATWLYGYDYPHLYNGAPPYVLPSPVPAAQPPARAEGNLRLFTGGPLGFDIPREHRIVASAVSPDLRTGVALLAFTGPPLPAWRSPYMVYELDYDRAMPRNSGDYSSRSDAYAVFSELAMALGAGQPEEGVRG